MADMENHSSPESLETSDLQFRGANRREHRNRMILLGAAGALFSKFPALLVTLVSVPLAIDALGEERFGIWITITTFMSLLAFLDGGAGNAVINIVAECDQKQEYGRMKSLISSAYAFVTAVATACFCTQFLVVPLIDWGWLLSLPESIPPAEVVAVALVGCGSYFLSMPLSIGARVLTGLQRTHVVALCHSVAHLVAILATIAAWYFHAGLTVFVICFASHPLISGLISTVIVLRRDAGRYRPCVSSLRIADVRQVLSVGGLFWVLQLCAAVAYQCDAVIVSHYAGLEATAKLGLVTRMFLIANSVTMLITGPLWPAFREASLSGDSQWVRSAFRKSMSRCLSASIGLTLVLAVFFHPINQLWTGGRAEPGGLLIVAVFVWSNLQVVGRIIAMLLNGLHVIRLQVVCSLLMTLANVVLSIGLTIRLGAPGVVLGSIIAFTGAILVPYFFFLPRVINSPNRLVT